MLTTDEMFDQMLAQSGGNGRFTWTLDALGGPKMAPILQALSRDGRVKQIGLGAWQLTLRAIAETVYVSEVDEAKLLADVDAMLPPNRGQFNIKMVVDQIGWEYPRALAAAFGLAARRRFKHKYPETDNFQILDPSLWPDQCD